MRPNPEPGTAISGPGRNEDGFALIVALWAVAVVGLVGLGYVATARARVTAAAAASEHVRLHLLAEAAVTRAIADVVDDGRRGTLVLPKRLLDGTPTVCALAEDATAVVTIEDEGGKVNLNTAPAELMAATFALAGLSPDGAAGLASEVLAARERAAAAAGTTVPLARRQRRGERRNPLAPTFQTVFELAPLTPDAEDRINALVPFLTVQSSQPGIDPQVAPLALLTGIGERAPSGPARAAATGPGAPSPARAGWQVKPDWSASSERQFYLVRAAVESPRARSSVEALVSVAPAPRPPYRVVEWRRDRARVGDRNLPPAQTLPPC